MTNIQGTIEDIEYFSQPDKAVVTLRPDKYQRVYIEFRGQRTVAVTNFSKGDEAIVCLVFEGKRSKTVNKAYNNLVGRSIKPLITYIEHDNNREV